MERRSAHFSFSTWFNDKVKKALLIKKILENGVEFVFAYLNLFIL